ncbi:hypothetical protein T10_2593, partial [Trichinella papuae]
LNLLIYMYIIEAFIAIILNQTQNSRHSVYLPFTCLNCMQRLLTWSIIFFSGTFKKHQRHPKYVSLASAE